jgi:chaperonin GroEL
LSYPLKLIAKNAGVNGSVVIEKVWNSNLFSNMHLIFNNLRITNLAIACIQVLAIDNFRYGYNAATGKYEDLIAAGIIDPTKVCACNVLLDHLI